MTTDEVPNAEAAYAALQITEQVLAQGAIVEAEINYQTITNLLRDWIGALLSEDRTVRNRAMRQTLPAEIDRLYLATEPLMGQFRTARYQHDVESACQYGDLAVQVLVGLETLSLRASDCLAEIGAFFVEQDDLETREYGRSCIEQSNNLRQLARLEDRDGAS